MNPASSLNNTEGVRQFQPRVTPWEGQPKTFLNPERVADFASPRRSGIKI